MNKKLNLFLGMCVATAFQLANNSCLATPLAGSSPKTSPKQIVFIDKSIKNYQQLSNDIQSNKHPNSTLLVPLDANNNAILEITKYLENYKNLDAIHLISHGFSGGLNFGNNAIDINTLNTQRSQLSLWRNALTQKGDILLYGCNVAKDKTGRDFINTLAQITHADIAASNNTTGNPRLGQDWLLEKQVGTVETAALFDNTHHRFTATLDILNENAFLYGNNIEVGIGPDGAFGSDISSPEMGRKSYGKLLGYISDPSGGQFKNSYHGDFFLPGYPEEGWAISLNGKTYNNNSNIQGAEIQGGLSNFKNTSKSQSVTWSGNTEGLDIEQVIRIYKEGISIIIDVTLKNTTSSTITDLYYMRTVDPDNNAEQHNETVDKFATINTIISQGDGGTGAASISAFQPSEGYLFDASLLTLNGYGSNARAAYGPERHRSPADVYRGSGLLKNSGSHQGDESISVAYKFNQLAPGNSVTFRTGYLLADIPLPSIDIDANNSSGVLGSQHRQVYKLGTEPTLISDTDIKIEGTGFTNLERMIISLTNPHSDDKLAVIGNLPSGIAIDTSDTTETFIHLQGTASPESYAQALRTVVLSNDNTTSSTETRNITIQVVDDNFTPSNTAISIIEIITPISLNETVIANDNIANAVEATNIIFSGSAAPNIPIKITLTDKNGNDVIKEINSRDDGSWTLTNNALDISRLNDGLITINIVGTDNNGNQSTLSQDITKDTVVALDNITPVDNQVATNFAPTFTGTTDPNAQVTLKQGGETLTTTADEKGDWSITLPEQALGATINAEIRTTDPAGNTAAITRTISIPELPLDIDELAKDPNGKTTSTTPTFSGTSDPGTAITVTVPNTNGSPTTCTTTTDLSGKWSCQISPLPSGGPYIASIKAEDANGNTLTKNVTLTVPELFLTVTSPAADATIKGNTPEFKGNSAPGTKITVQASTGQTCSATADQEGNWSCTIPSLPLGEALVITATTEDSAGNTATKTFDITTDKLPLEVAKINTDENNVSTSTTPTFTGTGDPGASIEVVITTGEETTETCNTTANAEGHWSCQFDELPSGGPYPVTITTTDALGNSNTTDRNITIPEVPLIISSPTNGIVLASATPTVSGTSTSGTTVSVETSTGQTCSVITDQGGDWSCTLPSLPLGEKVTITATTEDSAGNKTAKTVDVKTNKLPLEVTDIDTDENGVATSTTPTFTGTGDPGASIEVVITTGEETTETCSTTADAEGHWSCQFDELPSGGPYPLTVTTTDALGNTTIVEKDISIPNVPLIIDSPSNNAVISGTTPTVSGTSTPGTKITATTSTGHSCTAVTDNTNHWDCDLPTLPLNENFTLTVTTEDGAGNKTTQSIDLATDKLPLSIIAPSHKGTAEDSTPNLVGTTTPGSLVTVTVPTGESCQSTADADGYWACELPTLPVGGPYDLTIKAEDTKGNVTTIQASINIPAIPLIISSPLEGETIVEDNVVVTGTSDPDTEITVLGPDGQICKTVSAGDGTWRCQLKNLQTGQNKRITVLSGNTEANRKVNLIMVSIQNASEKVSTVLKGGGGSSSLIMLLLLGIMLLAKQAMRTRKASSETNR